MAAIKTAGKKKTPIIKTAGKRKTSIAKGSVVTAPIQANGKRKTSIAKAVIRGGKGRIRINRRPLETLEPELVRLKIFEPLILSGLRDTIDVDVTVNGGGFMGQTEAARTAIGKALIEYSKDKGLRDKFYEYDRSFVKDDVRRKESKKPGGRGARAKKQKSYR